MQPENHVFKEYLRSEKNHNAEYFQRKRKLEN